MKLAEKTMLTILVLKATFAFAMVAGVLLALSGLGVLDRKLPDAPFLLILFGAAILITGFIAMLAVESPRTSRSPGRRSVRS